jgi:arginine decarboxylase
MILLTNCTFDGIVYSPLPLVEEVLAISQISASCGTKLAFATAVPHARQRTAMPAAPLLEQRVASPEYRAEYQRWRQDMEAVSIQSTHKSLSALRRTSTESAAKHRCTSGHRAAPATQDVR